MTRRLLFASLFVGFALASTGCCGVLRNCVQRFRMNHGCCPPFGGCCDAGPTCSPSYSMGAPVMPQPDCAGCGAAAMPAPPFGANVPGYAYGVPAVPPGAGAKLTAGK